jgi:hypothetical protein
MKKFLCLAVFVASFACVQKVSATDFDEQLLLYLPNRFVDLADIFSLNLGFGPKVQASGRLTRFIGAGGGIGSSVNLVKDYNRQYGCNMEEGWSGGLLWLASEESEIYRSTRGVQKYIYQFNGIPSYKENIYNWHTGARDYWEIGGEVGLLFQGRFALHPVDLADFITGIFFIDLKGDDLTMESFRP